MAQTGTAPEQKETAAPKPKAPAEADANAPAQPSPAAGRLLKAEDLGWLEGTWEGQLSGFLAEQIYSRPKAGLVMVIYRLVGDKGTEVMGPGTFRETEDGFEFRVRHFNAALNFYGERDAGDSIQLKLVSYDGRQAVYENPVHTRPKRTVITRIGPDTMTYRSEIIIDGETLISEATYTRVK